MRLEEWPQVEYNIFDGTPYAMKVACAVWNGGKIRDSIKDLPIVIN